GVILLFEVCIPSVAVRFELRGRGRATGWDVVIADCASEGTWHKFVHRDRILFPASTWRPGWSDSTRMVSAVLQKPAMPYSTVSPPRRVGQFYSSRTA